MAKMIDLTGERFERLRVERRVENGKGGGARWLCICDCGKTLEVDRQKLRRGNTRSCGCLHSDVITTHNMSETRQYRTWADMLTRCRNPRNKRYKDYGGRGISVCQKWETFQGFWENMQDGYSEGLTIDRKNNDKGYFKDNCRWATQKQQANNRCTNVRGGIE